MTTALTAEQERQIRAVQKGWMIRAAAMREPTTPDLLHKWIKQLLGFHVPRVAPTEGQQAPFDLVCDAFFGNFERALVLASRGSGKTRDVSILNLVTSKFRPGTHTVHFGAVREQAGFGHEYLRDMLRPKHISEDLTLAYRDIVRWKNGSWVRTSTGSTETGVTAIRGNRLVQDEIDLWDMRLFEMSQMMIQGTVANPAQRIYVSTQYSPYGLMSQLLREAGQRGMRLYKWDVFAALKRCEECLGEDCPLFIWDNPMTGQFEPLCKGRGLRADGYVPRAAVVDEFESMGHGGREWAVEKLLEEPTREYLILPSFREDLHVGKAPPEAFAPSMPKACGVDWGFDHPLVFTIWAEVGDRIWGIHEHGERFVSPDREVEIAQELAQEYGAEGQPLVFYCDGENPQAIAGFQEKGLVAMACPVKGREARHRGIRRLLRKDPVLEGSRLMLDRDAMPSTIWQFATVHRDEKTGKEVKEQNDFFDSAEYALATVEVVGIGAGGGFMV